MFVMIPLGSCQTAVRAAAVGAAAAAAAAVTRKQVQRKATDQTTRCQIERLLN